MFVHSFFRPFVRPFVRLSVRLFGRCGPMDRAQGSGLSGPGSCPDRGHCVVFLDKTFDSQSPSLHPVV